MPTKLPRYFFTLNEADGEKLENLCLSSGLQPPALLHLLVPAAVAAIQKTGPVLCLPLRFTLEISSPVQMLKNGKPPKPASKPARFESWPDSQCLRRRKLTSPRET